MKQILTTSFLVIKVLSSSFLAEISISLEGSVMLTSCLETDLDAGAYLEEVTSWHANLAYHAFTTQWRRHI